MTPFFSIVTTTFNSEKTVEDTLHSLQIQTFRDFEHIIMDGKSKDKTLNIVEKYRGANTVIVSEKDKGIFDAMNKGLEIAKGEYVMYLNSDDFLASPNGLQSFADALKNAKAKIAYGDIYYVDRENEKKIKRVWRSGKAANYSLGWHPPHPAFAACRKLLLDLGGFREQYRIAADMDLMMRAVCKVNPREIVYVPGIFAHMRDGGNSSKGFATVKEAFAESVEIYRGLGVPFPRVAALAKVVRKIPQLVVSVIPAQAGMTST